MRAFCIHGHFYQPPREDPITRSIPLEAGALPYHNWNERIHDQCYRPNADLGNFGEISFNVGPTLMDWMDDYDPETTQKIIQQEQAVFARHGVGNGMAQAYNHTILPLATREDKITQVRWGLADFVHRFGHPSTGMWLPETAVDDETLQILAECGVEFTILAPWQVEGDGLDFSRPYTVDVGEGRKLAVFFYNQDLSTRISFDPGATSNADFFVTYSITPKFKFPSETEDDQFVLVASDGELYGHHQQFRDKFLSYLLTSAIQNHDIELSFPALWLQNHAPQSSVKIKPFTSWSCHHGVTRWMGPCSCTPHSGWKSSMRLGLIEIGRAVNSVYHETARQWFPNVWELRHEYIHVLLGNETLADICHRLSGRILEDDALHTLDLLLKAQFERQRMFTSCGWFFDDFDRIEPRNNVAYAAQAVWYTLQATGKDLSALAQTWLHPIRSWRSGLRADTVFNSHFSRARAKL